MKLRKTIYFIAASLMVLAILFAVVADVNHGHGPGHHGDGHHGDTHHEGTHGGHGETGGHGEKTHKEEHH